MPALVLEGVTKSFGGVHAVAGGNMHVPQGQLTGLIERFHLTRYAFTLAGTLADGHQRRLEMARAVASGPQILLLDEPVAGMNDVEANELGEIFLELAERNMGLILIEHNIRFVTKM